MVNARVLDEGGCIRLVGEIVKQGIEAEGPGYAMSPCGMFWVGLVGLEPEAVKRKAVAVFAEDAVKNGVLLDATRGKIDATPTAIMAAALAESMRPQRISFLKALVSYIQKRWATERDGDKYVPVAMVNKRLDVSEEVAAAMELFRARDHLTEKISKVLVSRCLKLGCD
jgi:hypothetical protein